MVVLTISLFPDGTSRLRGFTQFWLRYVRGFSPQFHCQRSLRGFNDTRFRRDLHVGQVFELQPGGHFDYIYLCGVTGRSHPGLHLALKPEPAASARVVTYNGLEVTADGARQLEIPPLPDGFAGMAHAYTSCVNWQFGVHYYGLPAGGA